MPKLIHASGRFDTELVKFTADLSRWMLLAGIVTLTEVARPGRRRRLKSLARRHVLGRPGWTLTAGKGEGPGECAIVTDRELWKRLRRSVVPITAGGGFARLARALAATTGVFQRRGTARHLIVSTTHLPARVETVLRAWWKTGGRTPLTPQARAWLRAIDTWAEHLADMRRDFPDADLYAPADYNVNGAAEWARDLVESRFRKAGHRDIRIILPARGTLGKRRIDFAVTTLGNDTGKVYNAGASDHHAVLFDAPWPNNLEPRKATP